MGDTEESREQKGTGKAEQTRDRDVEEELEELEESERRREEHDDEAAERELADDT